jgi:hypothetical protein
VEWHAFGLDIAVTICGRPVVEVRAGRVDDGVKHATAVDLTAAGI